MATASPLASPGQRFGPAPAVVYAFAIILNLSSAVAIDQASRACPGVPVLVCQRRQLLAGCDQQGYGQHDDSGCSHLKLLIVMSHEDIR